jgi:DNA repair protein RadA/Sms
MLLAVLDARAGLAMGSHDVYLNVAGGLKVSEPAADLATAAALVSAFAGKPLPGDWVFFGEVSLSGGVRPAPQGELRLKEAAKLGFRVAVVPEGTKAEIAGLELKAVSDVARLVSLTGGQPLNTVRRGRIDSDE